MFISFIKNNKILGIILKIVIPLSSTFLFYYFNIFSYLNTIYLIKILIFLWLLLIVFGIFFNSLIYFILTFTKDTNINTNNIKITYFRDLINHLNELKQNEKDRVLIKDSYLKIVKILSFILMISTLLLLF